MQFYLLSKLKLIRVINRIKARPFFSLTVFLFIAATFIVLWTGFKKTLLAFLASTALTALPAGVVSIILLLLLCICFLMQLMSGESLNLQISDDIDFYLPLPLKSWVLPFFKIFEQTLTAPFNILAAIPVLFLGVLSKMTFESLFVSLAILFCILFFCSILTNIVVVVLRLFVKKSAIEGKLSLFVTLITLLLFFFLAAAVYLSVNNPGQTILLWRVFSAEPFFSAFSSFWGVALLEIFLKPFFFAGTLLIKGKAGFDLLKFIFFSLLLFLPFAWIYKKLLDMTAYFSPPDSAPETFKSDSRAFSLFKDPICRKEFIFLKNNLNLCFNMTVMPVLLFIMASVGDLFSEGSQIFEVLPVLASVRPLAHIFVTLLLFYGSIYFVNVVGLEGESIRLLRTLPIAPGDFLASKTKFWTIMAFAVYLPLIAIAAFLLKLPATDILYHLARGTVEIVCMIHAAVSLSAIYARYSAKSVMQKSSFTAKLFMLFMMNQFLFINSFDRETVCFALTPLLLATVLRLRAIMLLDFFEEPEAILKCDEGRFLDVSWLMVKFVCLAAFIRISVLTVYEILKPGMIDAMLSSGIFFKLPDNKDFAAIWVVSAILMSLPLLFEVFKKLPIKEIFLKKFPQVFKENFSRPFVLLLVAVLIFHGYFMIFPNLKVEFMKSLTSFASLAASMLGQGTLENLLKTLSVVVCSLLSLFAAFAFNGRKNVLQAFSGALLTAFAMPAFLVVPGFCYFALLAFSDTSYSRRLVYALFTAPPIFAGLFFL